MNVLRAVLVVAATAGMILFNALAAARRIGGVTPEQISSLYPTLVTPAGYAFSIWSLIYLGLVAYSVYQLLPSSIDRFSGIRSLYIFSCVLNCAWIYFWHGNQIGFCLVIIATLVVALIILNSQIGELPKLIDSWLVKAPFGLYLGWVTAATLVNLAVALRFWNVPMTQSTGIVLAVLLIAAASVAGIVLRWKLRN
jgi:hypothetical protein